MSRRPSRPPSPRSRPVAPPTLPSVSTTHPAHLVALVVAFACVLASVSFRMYDLDVWQHLAFGRAMASLGEVPRTQLWTWPTHGTPVVNPSWGFSWLLWPFWTVGDVWGLAAWRWLTTAIVATFVWATARRLGVRAIPTLVTLVLCGLVIRSRSQARPETLALVWLAAVPFVLHLIMRRKPVKREFPALRFLRQRAVANRRRLRLNHILLLLLRMAAIALLALALARPVLRGAGWLASGEGPVAAASSRGSLPLPSNT